MLVITERIAWNSWLKDKEEKPADRTHSTKLHFDNVSAYMTSSLNDYLAKQFIPVMGHAAYSPDISLSDYWLFGFLKQRLEFFPMNNH